MQGKDVQEYLKRFATYQEGYAWMMEQVEAGKLRPVERSGLNGKKPPLYRRYIASRPRKDTSQLETELQNVIMPPLSATWYLRHLAQYAKDRKYVLALNEWIQTQGLPAADDIPISINERSYEIFHQEKLLKKQGKSLCSHLGLPVEKLNCYATFEPLVNWYSCSQKPGQNILIVENLDTFVSIRRYLMQEGSAILGYPIGSVLYGAGKRIWSSFEDLLCFGQDYLRHPDNTFYYFGDLDYEGLAIFETFQERYPEVNIQLFTPAYWKMMEISDLALLAATSQGQKEKETPVFWQAFEQDIQKQSDPSRGQILEELKEKMHQLLEDGLYIPQEALNRTFYQSGDPTKTLFEKQNLTKKVP